MSEQPADCDEVARDVQSAVAAVHDVVERGGFHPSAADPAGLAVAFDDLFTDVGGHQPEAFQLDLRALLTIHLNNARRHFNDQ